jgi:hypothetical protein
MTIYNKGRLLMPKLSYRTGLPKLLGGKIYKTGQTRGAENDEIFQNRVGRNSVVLIPLSQWLTARSNLRQENYENGFIIFCSPEEYFDENILRSEEIPDDLVLGVNLLIYYRRRESWTTYNPLALGLVHARSRTNPLGGQYIARVADTTSATDTQIFEGYISKETGGKGAGIRFFEYASPTDLLRTRYQLSYLAWHSEGILDVCLSHDCKLVNESRDHVIKYCHDNGLASIDQLEQARIIRNNKTVCPLCLEPMKAEDFVSKLGQAEGREVLDLTVTRANLFHIEELRPGLYNHREYNLGWGHHHCNTVVADMGIQGAIDWMVILLKRNEYLIENPKK